jgi:hypothetical protein
MAAVGLRKRGSVEESALLWPAAQSQIYSMDKERRFEPSMLETMTVPVLISH